MKLGVRSKRNSISPNLGIRQKASTLQELAKSVPLYQRSHYLTAGKRDKWLSVVPISTPRHTLVTRLPWHLPIALLGQLLLVSLSCSSSLALPLFSPTPQGQVQAVGHAQSTTFSLCSELFPGCTLLSGYNKSLPFNYTVEQSFFGSYIRNEVYS